MSDSLNAIFVLSYFPCSDFPGLLVCDEGDFGEMHTIKIVFVADTSTFFANVTGLKDHLSIKPAFCGPLSGLYRQVSLYNIMRLNVNVNVHVYSSDIPVSSTDCTDVTLLVLEHTRLQSHLL